MVPLYLFVSKLASSPDTTHIFAALDITCRRKIQLNQRENRSAKDIFLRYQIFLHEIRHVTELNLVVHIQPFEMMGWDEYRQLYIQLMIATMQAPSTWHIFVMMPLIKNELSPIKLNWTELRGMLHTNLPAQNVHVIDMPESMNAENLYTQRHYLLRALLAEMAVIVNTQAIPLDPSLPKADDLSRIPVEGQLLQLNLGEPSLSMESLSTSLPLSGK